MAATKAKPRGAIPDKIMRSALMVELASTLPHKVKDPQTGRERVEQFRKARLVAMSAVNAAIKGDVAAMALVFNRADGKLPNVIAGDPDAPLKHEHSNLPAAQANLADLTLEELVREHSAACIASAAGKARNETKH